MTASTAIGSTTAAVIQPTGPAQAARSRRSGNPMKSATATAIARASDIGGYPRAVTATSFTAATPSAGIDVIQRTR